MASARVSTVRCWFACPHLPVAHVRRRLHGKPPSWSRVSGPRLVCAGPRAQEAREPRAERPRLLGVPTGYTEATVRSFNIRLVFSQSNEHAGDRSGPRAHACRRPVLPGFRHETVTVVAPDFLKHSFESMVSCNFGAGLGGCDPNRRLSSLEAGRQPVAVQRREATLRSERQASWHARARPRGTAEPQRSMPLSGEAWTRHVERRPDGRC
jgi:hypothetical protein